MLPYLTFVVKGKDYPAGVVLADRHIVAYRINGTLNETVFETDAVNLDKLQDWFNEDPPMIPGYGYPDGTCLIFSIHTRGCAS